jgi:hypothetical protein
MGEPTFTIPEASFTVSFIAANSLDADLSAEASEWVSAGASYHGLVRLAARAVAAMDRRCGSFEPIYGPKASAELEPILQLWPRILAIPTTARLSARSLIELRAYPVHPLGVVCEATWADGVLTAPSEYFFHDLDHARFKVREDLVALGSEIPDAYENGSTLDPATGLHRSILPFAFDRLGDELWQRADARRAAALSLLARADAIADPVVSRAAELLLFEIIHEKSFPLEQAVIERELSLPAHIAKIRRKHETGFFGSADPGGEVIAALQAASAAIRGAGP